MPFLDNIEKQTLQNKNFRQVVYTAPHLQLVVMSLIPGEDIGEEIHKNTDQFFRIEQGRGEVLIGKEYFTVKEGDAILIPKGSRHNVINTGKVDLKFYTIYSPPEHSKNRVDRRKPR